MKENKRKNYLVLLLLVITMLLILIPYYIIVIASTHTTPNLFRVSTLMFGEGLKTNLDIMFSSRNFFVYIGNSLFVAFCRAVLTVIICSMAGYALAKYDFKLNKVIFGIVISSMMIPSSVGLVALISVIRTLGWMNTYMPLIFVSAASAFSVFWFRQASKEIPIDILESAYVDGSGEFRTFFFICFPLLRGAAITLTIITFINSWNEFLLPSIVLTSAERFTVPVGIAYLGSLYYEEHATRILAVLIGIAPVLVLYMLTSKYITKGLTQGAVKG